MAAFKLALTVGRLPKTRSGKILRKTMRHIANGEPYVVPPTIEDTAAIAVIAATVALVER